MSGASTGGGVSPEACSRRGARQKHERQEIASGGLPAMHDQVHETADRSQHLEEDDDGSTPAPET